MSWLDIVLLLPLLVGLIRGLMRGLVVEVTALVAIIIAFLVTKAWGDVLASWLLQSFTWPEAVCTVVAYVCLFLVIALTLNIAASLLSRLFKVIHLGGFNALLGGLFGVLKWGCVVLVLVFALHRLDMHFGFLSDSLRQSSGVYRQMTEWSEMLFSWLIPQSF